MTKKKSLGIAVSILSALVVTSAGAATRSLPGSACQLGLSTAAYMIYDHRMASEGTASMSAHCPVPQVGAGAIVDASVDVRDYSGGQEVSCVLSSRDRTGLVSFSTSPPVGTGAAFLGPKSLSLAPVTVFSRGSLEVRCTLPPQLGGMDSAVMSYAVTQ